MPHFSTQRRVPFTPEQMFAVVADVERYPEFLPLCDALTVQSREQTGDRTVLVAVMGVGYGSVHEAFTSRVTLSPAEFDILVENVDGPFSRLENRWRFAPAPGGSLIEFAIDYEFRSMMLRLLMGAVFDKAVRKYAEAFEARARSLYGVRSDAT